MGQLFWDNLPGARHPSQLGIVNVPVPGRCPRGASPQVSLAMSASSWSQVEVTEVDATRQTGIIDLRTSADAIRDHGCLVAVQLHPD